MLLPCNVKNSALSASLVCMQFFSFLQSQNLQMLEMAGRVLMRPSCSWITMKYLQFQQNPVQKTRSFCGLPNHAVHVSHRQAEDSQFRNLMPFSSLLQMYGFPRANADEFLRRNGFLLDFSLSEVEKSLGILSSFKLSDRALISLLSSYPRVLELDLLKRWEVLLSKSGISYLSPLMFQKIMELDEHSRIDCTNFCRIVQILKDTACSDETLAAILEEFPRVIMMTPTVMINNIEFLRKTGIGEENIDRVLCSFPRILGFSVEGRLKLLFEEFEALGFHKKELINTIITYPQVFNVEIGELSVCVQLLRNLNCRHPIQETILSKGLFRAALEVKLRIDCLCRYGLIHREAFKLLQREPRVIIYAVEDIEKKIDYLTKEMGFSISCLNEVPEYLGVNLKKVVIPRYNVIQYLKLNGGLTYELELKDLVKPSRLKFYNRFVKPYPACQKIFEPLSRAEVKRIHPVGLWNLFKPMQYLE